ncbi:MAG TPA: hypothetical protein VMS17_28440 [Gemmataceae bacterium]|nr:hypothetical protein [Gemmataceae bacterium]
MIQLIADDQFLLKDLQRFVEPVEVLDPSGKLLGLFVPTNQGQTAQVGEDDDSHMDWAEIERRAIAEAGQGRTLDQVFEHMKTLTSDPEEQADLQSHIDQIRAENGCDTP